MKLVKIDDSSVRKVCEKYSFSISDSATVIVAVRGCLPEQSFSRQAEKAGTPEKYKLLVPKLVDYRTASCTIGLWLRETREIALFPGSTVPSLHSIHAFPESVKHFNILCPGKYEFVRGIHPRRSKGYERHDALLMAEQGWVVIPKVIHTDSESLFDFSRTRYHIMYARDNLHASRTEPCDLTQNRFDYRYSSTGCLSIIGQPQQYVRNKSYPYFWNCWEQFMQIINYYTSSNERIPLLLFNHSDFDLPEKYDDGSILRYGSEGAKVLEIQEKLSQIYTLNNGLYYTFSMDGKFLSATAQAYLQFIKDYMPDKVAGEANLQVFNTLTKHFKYQSKNINYVIN